MAPPNADAATRIALRAQEHKLLFIGLNLAVPAMLHPDVPPLHWTLQLTGAASEEDVPVILGGQRGDEEKLSFSAREVLTKLTALRGDIVSEDILSIAMLLGATRPASMRLRAGLPSRHEPTFPLPRPLPKAAAHGDRWSFRRAQ